MSYSGKEGSPVSFENPLFQSMRPIDKIVYQRRLSEFVRNQIVQITQGTTFITDPKELTIHVPRTDLEGAQLRFATENQAQFRFSTEKKRAKTGQHTDPNSITESTQALQQTEETEVVTLPSEYIVGLMFEDAGLPHLPPKRSS